MRRCERHTLDSDRLCLRGLQFIATKAEHTWEPERYSKLPTASEVFSLRTKCAQLGRELDDNMLHGPAIHRETVSNYSAKSNRCYVMLSDTTDDMTDHVEYFRVLYDGQTQERLAWTKWRGPASKPDQIGHIESDMSRFTMECVEGGDCGFAKVTAYIDERMKREE